MQNHRKRRLGGKEGGKTRVCSIKQIRTLNLAYILRHFSCWIVNSMFSISNPHIEYKMKSPKFFFYGINAREEKNRAIKVMLKTVFIAM